MYRHGGVSHPEIGRRAGGLDYTGASRKRKWLREKIIKNKRLSKVIQEIETRLLSLAKI